MKKIAWTLVLLTLIGCSSSDSTESTPIDFSTLFHFSPKHGVDNIPISLVKSDETYHLFYSTGSSQWGHAISDDLISWQIANGIDIPGDLNGDIFIDQYYSAELSQGNTEVWFLCFSESNDFKMKYSYDGQQWNDFQIDVPSGSIGTPKITWYEPTESWLMTTTGQDSITVFNSENLQEWSQVGRLANQNNASFSQLVQVENKSILLTVGKNTQYQLVSFDGTNFSPTSPSANIDNGDSQLKGIIKSIDGRAILLSQIGNNSFATSREVSFRNNPDSASFLRTFPIAEFESKRTSKRRGKLSALKGDELTWFSFNLESVDEELEIYLSNEQAELLLITIDLDDNELTIDKRSERKGINGNTSSSDLIDIKGEQLKVDLLIDYASIEVFINDGEFALTTPVNPEILYNQVGVKIDGESYDARSIAYGFIQVQ